MNYLGATLLGIVIYPIVSSIIEWICNIFQLQTSKIIVKSFYLQNEINLIEAKNSEQDIHAIGFQIPDDEEECEEDYE